MTVRIKNSISISLLLFSLLSLNAQDFLNRSALEPVTKQGFYSISLSPELCGYLNADFSDLRIVAETKNWVPHIVKTGTSSMMKESFFDFPILKNQLIDSGKTEIVLKNTSLVKVFSIRLVIKNAAVSRMASISGSNDGHKWFIIDDHLLLHRSYETGQDEFLQEVTFPLSNYPYFKLVIDNGQNDPLNITRAGFYNQSYFSTPLQYDPNPLPLVSQKDSAGNTYLNVRWNKPYHIERILVFVRGQKFYNRELRICLPGTKENEPGQVIGQFRLASFTDSIFDIPRTKTDQLILIIKNDDNPALQVSKIESEQTKSIVLTYIDKPGNYHLLLNNKNTQAPEYDLILFRDSIPLVTGWLRTGPITTNDLPTVIAKKINRWWIWPAILIAIAVLGYISFSLTRDMKKRES